MKRAIDICAGAGGLSLGLQRAGFSVHGVERDHDATETHRAFVGPCDEADVCEWHPSSPADLVAGGVPCQPFSAAGLREGTRDERGELYRHLIRIAVEANAGAILLENVRGMMTWRDHDGTGVVPRIEGEMRAAGYEPTHRVLCAADYGTPQMRYRLFVVAFRDAAARAAFRWPAPTHGSRGNLLGLTPYVTVREALGLVGDYATGRKEGASGWQGMRFVDVDAPGYAIGTTGNADMLSRLDRPAPTITTRDGAPTPDPVRPSRRPLAELDRALAGLLDRPATTVMSGAGGRLPAAGHHDSLGSAYTKRLGVDECAALQGFPAEMRFRGTLSSQYRQVGNAVPPELGEAMGRAIRAALEAAAVEAA